MRLLELADLLDLVHEVSSVYILHYEIQSVLEGKDEEMRKERRIINQVPALLQVVCCHVSARCCALPWFGSRSAAE